MRARTVPAIYDVPQKRGVAYAFWRAKEDDGEDGRLQGDPSGWLALSADLLPTALVAGGPLL